MEQASCLKSKGNGKYSDTIHPLKLAQFIGLCQHVFHLLLLLWFILIANAGFPEEAPLKQPSAERVAEPSLQICSAAFPQLWLQTACGRDTASPIVMRSTTTSRWTHLVCLPLVDRHSWPTLHDISHLLLPANAFAPFDPMELSWGKVRFSLVNGCPNSVFIFTRGWKAELWGWRHTETEKLHAGAWTTLCGSQFQEGKASSIRSISK